MSLVKLSKITRRPANSSHVNELPHSLVTAQGQAGPVPPVLSRVPESGALLSPEALSSNSRFAGTLEPPAALCLTMGKSSGQSRWPLLPSLCKHVVTAQMSQL